MQLHSSHVFRPTSALLRAFWWQSRVLPSRVPPLVWQPHNAAFESSLPSPEIRVTNHSKHRFINIVSFSKKWSQSQHINTSIQHAFSELRQAMRIVKSINCERASGGEYAVNGGISTWQRGSIRTNSATRHSTQQTFEWKTSKKNFRPLFPHRVKTI